MIVAGNHTAAQSGVGMIEVLVAIVIVAFALFALIDVQTAALRYQKAAHVRATVSRFSADLADRVRANIRGAHDGAYNLSQQSYPALDEMPPTCFNPDDCTARELAAKDIHEWRSRLSEAISGGWGEISGSVVDGFTTRVYFREMHTRGSDSSVIAENCQPGAADPSSHKDVRCFSIAFSP
ncbi:MAG: type IV pilus modification protein PilV [Collimonas sp.]|uniref:type IV pilus modification protein PilV n=1 Tax=Collimonas sp. TaxID=1963772 RepID=UPI003265DEE1